MNRLILVLAVVLITLSASAQWLETTIDLPSSPQAVCCNPANNRVYCAVGYPGAAGAVVVIDGASNAVLETLLVGCQMPGGLDVDSRTGRVYCAGSSYYPLDDSLVTVIDNDMLAAQIPVGGGPLALALNPGNNRLYCACQLPNKVHVVDLSYDTVCAILPVGSNPIDLCYVPAVNKVYCANRGIYGRADHSVTVIDGARDSVRRAIGVGDFPRALCLNGVNGKVYSANGWSGTVSVIDVYGDTVVATVPVGPSPLALCYNPANNHVYCVDGEQGRLTVIDGASNGVLREVTLAGPGRALLADSGNNKVYCSNYLNDLVTVIDGRADTILTTIAVGAEPSALAGCFRCGRVYVANNQGNSLAVIRDSVVGGLTDAGTAAGRARPGTATVTGGYRGRADGTPAVLIDVSGRPVRQLLPGENRPVAPAPGIYFVLEQSQRAGGQPASAPVQKVVIVR